MFLGGFNGGIRDKIIGIREVHFIIKACWKIKGGIVVFIKSTVVIVVSIVVHNFVQDDLTIISSAGEEVKIKVKIFAHKGKTLDTTKHQQESIGHNLMQS